MKKRAKWFLAAAATIVLAAPANATQWGSYHWANNGTGLTLHIQSTFRNAGDWTQWYNEAKADWGNASNTRITLIEDGPWTGTTSKRCDPISGEALVCSDAYGQRGWLGIASIWANGDHITQATTKLNDSYFTTGSSYDTPAWRDMVTCQEVGHDFGLDHQDEDFYNPNLGTCMDYTNAPDRDDGNGPNLQPNGGDYASLTSDAMYGSGHNDSSGGSGGGGGNCNPHSPKCKGQDAFTFREVGKPAPSDSALVSGDWGRAIGYDRSGRPNEFELDLGNGRHRITHVFWVPGHRPLKSEMHD